MRHLFFPPARPLIGDDDEDPLFDADEELRAETACLHLEPDEPPARFKRSDWLKSDRMMQTEVSLRLAIALLQRRRVSSDVVVGLTGGELSRRSSARFPVAEYLRTLGFSPAHDAPDWRTRYLSDRAQLGLVLHNRLGQGDVVTTLASGRRFVAEVTGGPIKPTRSPTEHRLLRGVIGRAVTAEYSQPDDVAVAAVPRSERFRALARSWRELPRFAKTGVSIVIVDRAGTVYGCSEIDS